MRIYYLAVFALACGLGVRAEDIISANQTGTTLTPNTWTFVTPGGSVFSVPGWEQLHYVPAIKKHCVLGNYVEANGEPNRAWICYDAARNYVTVYDISGYWHSESWPDAGHPVGGYTIDPATSNAVGLCCNSGAQVAEGNRRWSWQYDFFSQTGRAKMANAQLPNALQMGGTVAPSSNTLVVHGGDSGFIGTSEYNILTNNWSQAISCTAVASNCPTPGAINPALAYRSVDGKIYLFGGVGGGQTPNNNVYVYTVATHTWSVKTTPAGTGPAARETAGWVYMDRDDLFFLYGGDNGSGTGFNDAWTYDPVANQWTQLSLANAPTVSGVPWDRVSYDPDLDLIVNIRLTLTSHEVYVVRLKPGVKLGYAGTPTYTFTPGGINRTAGTLGRSPSIASSGTTIYHGWVESTQTPTNQYEHPFAQTVISGSKTNLGSTLTSIANNTINNDGTKITVSSGIPWICWETAGGGPTGLWSAGYSGGLWSLGGQVDTGISGACSITDVGGVPHVAYTVRNGLEVEVRVKKFSSGSWTAVGGRLNINSTNSWGGAPSIASDGTNPCVAWDEYVSTSLTSSLVHVSCWNGSSAWVQKGTSANVSTSNIALFPSLSYLGSTPYVAFVERTASGNALLYVRSWNSTAWVIAGSGAINRDVNNGWAMRPWLANDGSNIYAAWIEQGNQQGQSSLSDYGSYGQRGQGYVAKLTGSTWAFLGGSLNVDTANGSASQLNIAANAGTVGAPSAIWGEINQGAARQIYAKTWTGTDWTLTIPTGCAISPGSVGPWTIGQPVNQAFTNSGCVSSSWSSTGTWPTGITFNTGTGTASGTVGGSSGTFTPHVLYDTANNLYSIVVNAAPVITTATPLPAGTQNVAYSPQTLTASPTGTTPDTWDISAGTICTGIILSSNGVISGTPTVAPQTCSFTARVTDANGIFNTKAFSITINAGVTGPSITNPTSCPLPAGTVGTPYSSIQFAASGGTAPLAWSKTGTLPTGLTFSSAGLFSGTPTQAITQTLTYTVTDANSLSASLSSCSITINASTSGPLSIVTPASCPLPVGQVNVAYNLQFTSTGGTAPITWSKTGTLPTGLTFNASGLLGGTPTQAITQILTFSATDSLSSTASRSACSITTASASGGSGGKGGGSSKKGGKAR